MVRPLLDVGRQFYQRLLRARELSGSMQCSPPQEPMVLNDEVRSKDGGESVPVASFQGGFRAKITPIHSKKYAIKLFDQF